MVTQALLRYVKENLTAGFTEEEIRRALRQAGWEQADIEEAFTKSRKPTPTVLEPQTKKNKVAITVLVLLIVIPILAYGGFILYKRFTQTRTEGQASQVSEEAIQGVIAKKNDEALARDSQRLANIQEIQIALNDFYQTNKFYPKSLAELANSRLSLLHFTDPKTSDPYLYITFGDPALRYSLSFVLEGDFGTLKKGLQVASSEVRILAETLEEQEGLIRGKGSPTSSLEITTLGQSPFRPNEDVVLEIKNSEALELVNARLVIHELGLDLFDRSKPFWFKFTAPHNTGTYTISVFGFNAGGVGYSASTTLVISPHP